MIEQFVSQYLAEAVEAASCRLHYAIICLL